MKMDQPNVGDMNGFYGRQYSADDLQRLAQVNSQNAMMSMMAPGSMGDPGMIGGQTLDEIINQNNKEMQRRRSYHQQYGTQRSGQDSDLRRASMLEFGPGTNSDLEGFQFDPASVQNSNGIGRGQGIAQRRLESHRARRRQSDENLVLNTQFQDLGSGFNTITQSPVYQQSLNPSEALNLDVAGTYMPQNLPMGMDYSAGGLAPDISGDVTPLNMFSQSNFAPSLTTSPIQQNLSNTIRGPTQDPGGGLISNREEQDLMEKMPNMQMTDQSLNIPNNLGSQHISMQGASPSVPMQVISDSNPPAQPRQNTKLEQPAQPNLNSFSTADQVPNGNSQSSIPQYRNAYSSSGFDMLGVLMRVATRPKPQINIGAVDMSCAFVVCDITKHDLPIVYCSDIFERLTGYTKHEILGRNCRFLQAPDGKVQSGLKRKYVDDQAVLHLKNMINQRQEAQISLINYRKGGQPFMNLLTIIPVTYNTDEMKYYVGFQVDLVEQPTSITNKNPGKPRRL